MTDAAKEMTLSSDIKKLKLLLAGDNREIQDCLSENVKKIFVSANPENTFELYLKTSPHLVIVDMDEYPSSNIKLIKNIREKDYSIKIILLSESSNISYYINDLPCEINGCLLKPIDKNRLYSLLNTLVKHIYYTDIEKKKRILAQKILDAGEDLITVVNDKKVEFSNRAFLNFFDVKTVEEFNERGRTLCDYFIHNENYFGCEENSKEYFIDVLLKLPREKRVVSMIIAKYFEPRAFMLKINKLNNKQAVLVFSDITRISLKSKEFEKQALYDELTKIYNRVKFNEMLDFEVERNKRYGNNLSLIILDLDDFKQINDNFGHLVGDRILVETATVVKNTIRATDITARWGGEEFVVLLSNCDLENARKVADTIREKIKNFFVKNPPEITCSLGVAQLKEYDTKESFIHEADKALYRAKRNGKNRVEISK